MKTAIVNLGKIITGDWRNPVANGDTIICDAGTIVQVGTADTARVEACDVVIDAAGAVAIPGLINSHVHITFGDYTPRQKTVGFLESYVHGGVTTAITASEVHVPGRPKDPAGVKALAVAALKSFQNWRPGGMRVHAGSVILEPGLYGSRFRRSQVTGRLARESRIWRIRYPLRIQANDSMGPRTRHDHNGAHRRVVNSGILRDLGGAHPGPGSERLIPC